AVGRRHTDLHVAAEHGHHTVVLRPHEENILARREAAHMGARNQRIARLCSEIAEKNTISKEPAGFFQTGGADGFQRVSPQRVREELPGRSSAAVRLNKRMASKYLRPGAQSRTKPSRPPLRPSFLRVTVKTRRFSLFQSGRKQL